MQPGRIEQLKLEKKKLENGSSLKKSKFAFDDKSSELKLEPANLKQKMKWQNGLRQSHSFFNS